MPIPVRLEQGMFVFIQGSTFKEKERNMDIFFKGRKFASPLYMCCLYALLDSIVRAAETAHSV